MSTQTTPLNAFLLVDKPIGPTSHDIVDAVRRLLPRKTKVGHAGTLDPLASGLLILGVGQATKQLARLVGLPKTYACAVTLGATSATDDGEGPITTIAGATPPSQQDLEHALEQFIGTQEQLPPVFSAKKIGGTPLYTHARQGAPITPRPQTITVETLTLDDYQWPSCRLTIHCSSGTYVRAIARDLGNRLGVGGFVSALRRLDIGPYRVAEAIPLPSSAPDVMASLQPAAAFLDRAARVDLLK